MCSNPDAISGKAVEKQTATTTTNKQQQKSAPKKY